MGFRVRLPVVYWYILYLLMSSTYIVQHISDSKMIANKTLNNSGKFKRRHKITSGKYFDVYEILILL